MQDWRVSGKWRQFGPADTSGWKFITQSTTGDIISGRYSTTTHGKQKGVKFVIKTL